MEARKGHEVHLSDYWNVIKKRQWIVLTFISMTLLISGILTYTKRPVYQAGSTMVIEKASNRSPVTGQVTDYETVHTQFLTFNTHFELIKSKPVIERLLRTLKLQEQPGKNIERDAPLNPVQLLKKYIKEAKNEFKNNINLLLKKEKKVRSEVELWNIAVRKMQSQIDISNTEDTRLLNIKVNDVNPARAAKIANKLAETYVEFDLASRLEAANQNLAWLNKEVYSMKKRLEDDERKFYEYKQEHRVFSLSGKQKVIDQKIRELNNEYLTTKNKRQELETKLNEIEKQNYQLGNMAYIRSIVDNKAIDKIYNSLTSLELEKGRLSKVFRSKHPKMVQISAEIAKVQGKLRAELNKEIENLKIQKNILINREKAMEESISEFEGDALNTSSKELKYTILQRNMDTSQKLYETMVEKIKESGIASSSGTSNIRIVERASTPLKPIKPNKKKNLLLSLVMGIFGGIGIAFLLEYLDQTIKSEDDVLNYLGLPVLSVVPEADRAEKGDFY